jgi:hypothetical protein
MLAKYSIFTFLWRYRNKAYDNRYNLLLNDLEGDLRLLKISFNGKQRERKKIETAKNIITWKNDILD